MQIIFAGTPEFAAGHLRYLLEHSPHTLSAVLTQPDRPAGRGKKTTSSPVKLVAECHGLRLLQPPTLRSQAALEALVELEPDVLVVVAYGLILPKEVLSIPRYGCINVHASLLPRWRGAAPIHRAIEAGDTETGITIMQMNEGLDTGDILLTVSCPIDANMTTATLHDRLLALGAPLLSTALDQIESHTLTPKKQNEAMACYAPKISKQEARIDWWQSAAALDRKIRAFNPTPVAFFESNCDAIRVWRACAVSTAATHHTPGTIIEANKNGITVSTGNGALILLELQLPGKKTLSAADVLNAYRDRFFVGAILS